MAVRIFTALEVETVRARGASRKTPAERFPRSTAWLKVAVTQRCRKVKPFGLRPRSGRRFSDQHVGYICRRDAYRKEEQIETGRSKQDRHCWESEQACLVYQVYSGTAPNPRCRCSNMRPGQMQAGAA